MNRKSINIQLLLFILLFSFSSSTWADIRIVVIGSSTAAPNTVFNNWTARYTKSLETINPNNQVINLAKGNFSTFNVLPDKMESTYPNKPNTDKENDISAALKFRPDAIIINLPTNDISLRCSVDEIMANFKITT